MPHLIYIRTRMLQIVICIFLALSVQLSWSAATTITVAIEGNDKPIVVGKTNLPSGMELMVTLISKDNTYHGQSKTTVRSGQFQAGPFSRKNGALDSGTYQLDITSPIASFQSKSVRAVIGEDGENLSGPLSKKSVFGHGRVLRYEKTIRIGTGKAAMQGDRTRSLKIRNATKQLVGIIQHGRSMERLRKDNPNAALECGIQMRIWQPRAKALGDGLDFGYLKAAAAQSISCVSCLSTANSYCDRAEEVMRSK